jgi:hypothetical protein
VPVEAKDALKKARDAGISDRTLKRARSRLRVRAEQVRDEGTIARWQWSLPTTYDDGLLGTLGPLGPLGKGAKEANGANNSNGSLLALNGYTDDELQDLVDAEKGQAAA